jgi:uridine phosphorylase
MTRPIAESELILNGRGAVYHLDLLPEELAPVVITVGDPDRVAEISKYFDHIAHRSAHREFITHTGRIGGLELSVISTGIGPDNIDIVLNELDALVHIDFKTRTLKEQTGGLHIIRMGTCGGLQPDIPTDGLIVSSHGLGLDNLLHYYRLKQSHQEKELLQAFATHAGLTEKPLTPYLAAADTGLLEHFTARGYFSGITVTCPGFYGPQGRSLRIPVAFPDLADKLSSFRHRDLRITNFEMETSAIYGLGRLMGHHCLSVNTVVANRSTGKFSKDPQKAIAGMIARSLEALSAFGS